MTSTTDEVVLDIEKEENSRIAKSIQKLIDDNQGKLRLSSRESENSTDHKYMFSRVLDSVRKEGEHDYEPQIISIGPIHRDKEALKPMEVLKRKYLSELIDRNPVKNTLENYVSAIRSVGEDARKLYSESVKLDDDNFVEMMVLDGCFLVEFFVKNYCGVNQQRYLNEVSLSRRSLTLLRRDLLLLENQIPFLILDVLFKSSDFPGLDLERSSTLQDLIFFYVTSNRFNWYKSRDLGIPNDVVHLLHMHHACLQSPHNNHESSYYTITITMSEYRGINSLFASSVSSTLQYLQSLLFFLLPRPRACRRALPVGEIPSATQLYHSGVNFKKKKKKDLAWVGATFDKEEGVLEISTFLLEEAEISTFRNLIAFEQAYPRAGNRITGHALLMTCLVRTAEDVAKLRDSGIIESMLNNDKHVVQVFDQFLRGCYLDYERLDYNRKLFKEVLEYCSVGENKFWVDFRRSCSENRWTVASLIAAIVALFLTFAQTFYTIYAYHHPPST